MSDPIIVRLDERRRREQAAAVLQAQDTTPDQVAEQQTLAQRAGVPLGIVRTDPATIRRQVERDDLDGLHRASPELGTWATRPDNFAIARDDLGALGTLAAATRKLLFAGYGDTPLQDAGDMGRAFTAAIPRTLGSTLTGGAAFLDAAGRRGARSIEALLGLEADQVPLDQRIGSPMTLARTLGGKAKSAADAIDVPEDRQNIVTDIAGGVGQLGTQVVQALFAAPTLVPSLLSQGADQMAERVEASKMDGTLGGDLAILGGAGVTALTEKYGLDKLLNRVPTKLRNAVLRRIADAAVGGTIEAAQEVTEGIAQDLLHKALLDDDQEIGQGILRQAEAAGGTGAIARLLVQIAGGRRAHAQAQVERETLAAAVQSAEATKTRTRAPGQFEAAVEAMAQDRMVYAPLDALAEHFAGTDAGAAINALAGNPNAYAEAIATGTDVAIPLARYLAQIGTAAHSTLSGRVRLQPAEEIRPDTILPDRTQIEQQIAEGLTEARNTPDTVERIRSQWGEYRPLLTDPAQADDWPGYQAAVERARASEVAERTAERDRVAAIARDKRLRRDTQAIVENDLRTHPVYRAERLLRSGKGPDGNPAMSPVKLDHAAVVAAVGEDAAARLKGMTRKHKGITPDAAAALLGYPSGAKLLHDMTTAPAFADMVQIETDARVGEQAKPQERHADDAQAEVLLREVQAIEARNGGVRTQDAALREIARRIVADKQAIHLQPHVYRLAEAKAAREAYHAAARGDLREAGQARRRQLQNLYLYREARNARDDVTSAGKRFAQLSRRTSRARVGLAGSDYQEQLDALLGRFDFRPITGPQLDARTSLAKWIKAKAEDGVTIDLPPHIADEAFRTPFRKLKVGEVRDLRNAVEQIVHAANEANVLRDGVNRYDRMLVDQNMAMSVRQGNRLRTPNTGDKSLGELAREEVWKARAVMGSPTDLARELDGFQDGGGVWDHTVGVIADANDRTQVELDRAADTLAQTKLRHYSKSELRGLSDRRHFPGIGDWSKARILSLALNWGNAGNREAILTQAVNRLAPQQVGELLGSLDARDWAFVQDVWKQIDGYWPEIQQAARRRTGIAPEKVAPTPFGVITRDGQEVQIPGGYFPLKYEADSVKGMRDEAAGYYDAIRTGRFAKAATRDGHTIERVGSGGNTVRLDLGVVDSHLRDVVRDLNLGDAVNMVHQALRGQEFAGAVRDTGLTPIVRGLDYWLRDVATGELGLRSSGERAVRILRTNFTAAVLTWRVSSALLQLSGVVQSSVVLGKGPMVDGVRRFARRPVAMTRYAREASPFMARRMQSHVEAVQAVQNAKAGRLSTARAEMIRRGYWMIGQVQSVVDVSTWIAAEKVGMRQHGGNLAKARRFADDVVRRAQGSGEWSDKSGLQRGTLSETERQSEWIRATTTLMGFLIAKQNAGYEQIRKADVRSVRGAGKLAGNLTLLFVIDGMLAAILRGQVPDDDDDDGSTVDDWLKAAGSEAAGSILGGMPGLSQLVTEMRGYTDRGLMSELWHSVAQAQTQIEQGEADKGAATAAIKVAGLSTGLPSTQINKTIEAVSAAQDGREVTPWEYLNGPQRAK